MVDMRKELIAEMYRLEDRYWWHVAKRTLVKNLLGIVGSFEDKKLVDVGCGTGKFLEEMSQWQNWKEIVGLDGSDDAIKFSKARNIAQVKKSDFEKKLRMASNSVDVITSLDVVEHIDNDVGLVEEFYRILKPGGVVAVTVPAHQWLWTYWDEELGHKRRYTKRQIHKMLTQAGFEVVRVSYFYSYLLPIAVGFRFLKMLLPDRKRGSDFIRLPEIANQILINMSRVETWVLEKVNVPFGLSVIAIVKKKIPN